MEVTEWARAFRDSVGSKAEYWGKYPSNLHFDETE